MRHLGWLFAIVVAILAIQVGKNTNGATPSAGLLSTDTMNIAIMQRHADKNMPVTLIDAAF